MDRKSLVTLRRLAMKYASLSALALIALTSAAAAQTAPAPPHENAQLAVALIAMFAAGYWAWQAFGRGSVPVADVPTFPKYMTSRGQYQVGNWLFAGLASLVFMLLVYLHRSVFTVASGFSDALPAFVNNLVNAAKQQAPEYLVIVVAIGAIYLFVLNTEGSWNVVLMMRDAIYRCISIPQLASRIVDQIRFSLKVPSAARAEVIASTPGLVEQDFRKASNTPDRRWAETCYMKWWLVQGQEGGDDGTFFAEQSFGFNALLVELDNVSVSMNNWKSGGVPDISLPDKVSSLHNRFSRLVALYLIYRNSSRKALATEALQFGIIVNFPRSENPLEYWILYLMVLLASVYVGVYVSAVGYDLAVGQGLSLTQDIQRTVRWMIYASANYGVAIIVILLLRLALNRFGDGVPMSHLITYCWTFLVAFVVGPTGLGVALKFLNPAIFGDQYLWVIISDRIQWGIGPALVCVYISYYLDRQSCADMPSIDHSSATIGWRLLNALAFATVTLLLLVPALMSIGGGQPAVRLDVWPIAKLQAVATGTAFLISFALALAAQFAIRDKSAKDTAAGGPRAAALPASGA